MRRKSDSDANTYAYADPNPDAYPYADAHSDAYALSKNLPMALLQRRKHNMLSQMRYFNLHRRYNSKLYQSKRGVHDKL